MHQLLALGAPTYTLSRDQWVPGDIETIFAFFQDPRNLEAITPDGMRFHIVRMEPETVQEGMLITYRMRIFGLPARWVTRIETWEPNRRFTDVQLQGPYILWHHTHTFAVENGGVRLGDTVRYRLPFGPIGALAHRLLVRRQLAFIFDYRSARIAERFGEGGTR